MPVKAVMLTPNLSLGGAERWIVSLIKYTDPSRVNWIGTACSGHGGADKELCEELQQYTELHCGKPTATRPFAVEYFKQHDTLVDVVTHLCKDADVLVTWGTAKLDRLIKHVELPIVLVSHSTFPCPLQVSGPTHIAGVSEKSLEQYPAADLPTEVIWNGADAARVVPRQGRKWQRKQWGVWPWEVVIGYLGRHSEEKRPEAAIEALSKLPHWYKAVYYGWSIEDDYKPAPELVQLAEELAPGRVGFYLPQPHVGDVLAGIDVFMLASHREAFSLGLAEAWLAGKSVVATPVGSVPEINQQYGELSIELPLDPTPDDLAAAVERAVTPTARKLAKEAQEIAQIEWTCEAMARRWEDYLERVVSDYKQNKQVGVYNATQNR